MLLDALVIGPEGLVPLLHVVQRRIRFAVLCNEAEVRSLDLVFAQRGCLRPRLRRCDVLESMAAFKRRDAQYRCKSDQDHSLIPILPPLSLFLIYLIIKYNPLKACLE